VPQGSVLGPLLFLIYINDLPDNIKSLIRLFADDSLLYKKIKSKADWESLQKDLDEAVAWCTRWHMSLNLDKCEHMKVTLKHQPLNTSYHLGSHSLSQVTNYKYLGVNISNNLSWNAHLNTIINKASKVLYVTKLALGKSSRAVKVAAYKTIIRPLLEYSSSVWDPFHVNQIEAVERVQRRAARFCMNNYKKQASVTDMITDLHWNSLSQRRLASRLASFCRAYNDHEPIKDIASLIVKAPLHSLRGANPYRVNSITCKKDVAHYSFLPRTIRDWNSLKLLDPDLAKDHQKLRQSLLYTD